MINGRWRTNEFDQRRWDLHFYFKWYFNDFFSVVVAANQKVQQKRWKPINYELAYKMCCSPATKSWKSMDSYSAVVCRLLIRIHVACDYVARHLPPPFPPPFLHSSLVGRPFDVVLLSEWWMGIFLYEISGKCSISFPTIHQTEESWWCTFPWSGGLFLLIHLLLLLPCHPLLMDGGGGGALY